MSSKEKLPYSKDVENYIREAIRGGVTIRDMIAGMQHLQAAPRSLASLYKIYGDFISAERASINQKVGKKVIDQALEGDFKSQEFFLRSRGGWSPQSTVNDVDEDSDLDEQESAVDRLMALLGKK